MLGGFTITLESDMDEATLQELVESQMHVKSAAITPMVAAVSSAISGDHYHAMIHFEEDSGMENLRAFMLVNTLRKSCAVISFSPADI
jgi:hypothetical protein